MGLTVGQILGDLRSESVGVESVPIDSFPANFGDEPIRSLYVEGAGTVTFIGLAGEEDTWTVPDFYTIPIAMQQVVSATATGLHGVR